MWWDAFQRRRYGALYRVSPKELLLGGRFDQNGQRPGFKNPELKI
jgi:hypothetical protein